MVAEIFIQAETIVKVTIEITNSTSVNIESCSKFSHRGSYVLEATKLPCENVDIGSIAIYEFTLYAVRMPQNDR